ncbi:MAG: DsrE family protein [Bacteroidetes bacterium]|jgi:hypothetical protein|nr:DsrE family protein [Bacteroidota bacterium]MBT4398694.1 DsrE family protein [Bacteroidota bacterium]MBT4409659.1 DsrE family protein [Bacteroidota bacterium]MBT7094475.1 DsrE family protein [Bacteroidota bacterium]MBT7465587.1 DsrE family protein [Bacteroidota bacterium]
MKTHYSFRLIILFFGILICGSVVHAQDAPPAKPIQFESSDTLLVVWSSGDPELAEKVCFMYAYNAKKWAWFKEVIFVVWGPSQKLLAENEKLQEGIEKMKEIGMIVEACVACARMYGVDEDLREMDIDVKGMGTVLTKYLKAGYPNITF